MANEVTLPRLIHIGRLHAPARSVFDRHAHPCHELIIPLRGRIQVDLGQHRAEAGPGDLLWYPAGSDHREQVPGNRAGDWHYLLIDWQGGQGWPLVISDRAGRVRQLSGLIAEASADQAHDTEPFVQALTAAIVIELTRLRADAGGQSADGLSEVIGRWITQHLAEPITLDRLATVAGLSCAHFARTYHQRTGRAPMAALREMRLAKARELLLNSDLPLRAVAAQVGFGSEYLLSRWLTRRFGFGARSLRRGRRRIGMT